MSYNLQETNVIRSRKPSLNCDCEPLALDWCEMTYPFLQWFDLRFGCEVG
uniref:Uncharacterized protein n=1 Tax=Arundo donax TaxID=35708 RepID=A0A0A9EAI3_ARUDO